MPQINNTELLLGMRNDAKVQNAENVPTQLAEKVVPVMEVNPKLLKDSRSLLHISRSTTTPTTPGTLLTTLTKPWYVTAVSLTYIADVAADNTQIRLRLFDSRGNTLDVPNFLKPTTTISYNSQTISFPSPIYLPKGAQIYLLNVFSAGTSNVLGEVIGYEIDN